MFFRITVPLSSAGDLLQPDRTDGARVSGNSTEAVHGDRGRAAAFDSILLSLYITNRLRLFNLGYGGTVVGAVRTGRGAERRRVLLVEVLGVLRR